MSNNQDIIAQLIAFKNKEKFSASVWEERGLNPSPAEMCIYLQQFFNDCAARLILAVEKATTTAKLKALLKQQLGELNADDYDTEESEFICDLFYELGQIIGVDIDDALNAWLYGEHFGFLQKITDMVNKPKPVETLFSPCTDCAVELETHIIARQESIPHTGWIIGRCNSCNGLNLLSFGKGVKQLEHVNYGVAEILSPSEYNYEQALARLEQVRLHRK